MREWLRDNGYDPDKILAFEDMDIPFKESAAQDERAIDACLRIWLKENGHEAGNLGHEKLIEKAQNIMVETGNPLPTLGKQLIRDGKNGSFIRPGGYRGCDDHAETASSGRR